MPNGCSSCRQQGHTHARLISAAHLKAHRLWPSSPCIFDDKAKVGLAKATKFTEITRCLLKITCTITRVQAAYEHLVDLPLAVKEG